ncbi:helix-turn-helix domain-containing protein [Mitsuaria sp. 7]|uniref:helix-turn-helix domain-containing protein n=1 Tax=Mitsuaria sp. 7 TaxID=1658665 RepID=UPI001E528833|nr:helix-turn-helix transcriptional regulator [Mitsuaria sp. 7]
MEIKVRREELGFSQEDLAGQTELGRPYISLLEVGKKQPTISVLYRIAVGLGLTFGEFADRVERRYKKEAKRRRAAAKA